MNDPITKDGDKARIFHTGARRDTDNNKPRWDLIPIHVLNELQQIYGGAPLVIDDEQPHFTDYCQSNVRPELIPDIVMNRMGALYGRGALKYGVDNYKKGFPLSAIYSSLFRHIIQWYAGDTSEDHLSAALWGLATIIWTEHAIATGELPEDLADIGPLS